MKGGVRGTAIVAGDADSSLLIRAITHGEGLKMPPTAKLPENVVRDFREWVRAGAVWPAESTLTANGSKHWAFQPVAKVRGDIDSLLGAALRKAGLTRAPEADRRTLLRRVTFDLHGLPPTPDEINAFLADTRPGAWERVVDRLLASPHYGERWGRHWLDLVRFAETKGHEFDFYNDEAWRYRDYVIRAFNEDLPYNQFVAEQIAGDLLPNARHEARIATGFFGLQEERNGATDLEEVRMEMRDSKIDVFGKAFLGLTVACARCHDHKFDPITARDYYALGGVFDSTRTTLQSIETPEIAETNERLLNGATGKPGAKIALRDGDELFDLTQGWQRSGSAFRHVAEGRLDSSRGVSSQLTGIMVSRSFVPAKKYMHVRLAGTRFNPVREEPSLLAVTMFAAGRYPKGVAGDGSGNFLWKTVTLKEEVNQVCHLEIADRKKDGHIAVDAIVFSNRRDPPDAPAGSLDALSAPDAPFIEEPFGRVTYEDGPRNLKLHIRGNHLQLGEEVPRGFLSVLGGGKYVEGSGRLALANAMTNPANPLLARVMVNRIWKHHFGEGLAATVDNFGATGEPPAHPDLLDALATNFVESGWSVKAMQRRILTSAAYRMSHAPPPPPDPRNRLLSAMSVRRLDAESIRDAVLAVSGTLERRSYGPSVTPHISPWQDGRGKPASGPLDGSGRRTVYLEVRRNFLTPLLLAFDFPLPTTTAGRRLISTVPSQALVLLNNEFIAVEAERWASRMTEQFRDPKERLDAMYVRAFSRTPSAAERTKIDEFLKTGGTWSEVAHVLFNAKEFLFVR